MTRVISTCKQVAYSLLAKEEIHTGDIISKKMSEINCVLELIVYRWEETERVNVYPENAKRPVKKKHFKEFVCHQTF